MHMASFASRKYTAVTEQIASYTILPFNFTFIAVILDCSVKLGGDAQTLKNCDWELRNSDFWLQLEYNNTLCVGSP